jgi:O-antigen ligase
MLGKSAETASTVDYRARLLTRGMEEYWKSPLIGYSQPEVLSRLADMRQGEGIIDFVNTYLFFALVSGAIGVICFIAAFVFYIRGMLRFRGALGRADRSLAVPAFLVAGLVMPMEMLVFTSFGGRCEVMVFVLFGLAAAQMAFVQPPYRRRRASYSAIAQTA